MRKAHLAGASKSSLQWEVYQTLKKFYKDHQEDITTKQLESIHELEVIDSRKATKDELAAFFIELNKAKTDSTVEYYLKQCKLRTIAAKASDDLKEIIISPDSEKLAKTAERIVEQVGSAQELEQMALDTPEEATAAVEAMSEFSWGCEHFDEMANGFGRTRHCLIYALTGMGKSSFTIDKIRHFLAQELRVLDISVAEDTKDRRIPHLVQTINGLTRESCVDNYEELYSDFYGKHNGNYYFKELPDGYRVNSIKPMIKQFKPDIVIVDGFMKLSRGGTESNKPAELASIISALKSMATEHNFALIACCQASQSAKGKKLLSAGDIAQSKVDVPGEFEIAVGIGCNSENPDQSKNRWAAFAKQKIGKAGVLCYEFTSQTNNWRCIG